MSVSDPAGQTSHLVETGSVEYLPATQKGQSIPFMNLPGGHVAVASARQASKTNIQLVLTSSKTYLFSVLYTFLVGFTNYASNTKTRIVYR